MRQKLEGRGGQKRGGGILIGWKLACNWMHRLAGNVFELKSIFCSLNLLTIVPLFTIVSLKRLY